MAQIGLKRAAELTGKNGSTIHRAMKNGRLSFTMSESGERMIDPAELDRVFPVKPQDAAAGIARKDAPELQSNVVQLVELRAQLDIEQARVAMLQERVTEKDTAIADLREDRDRWRVQAEKATLLLTDQTRKVAEQPPAPKGWRGFLHRLAG